jgi:TPR repeat protein
MDRLKILQDTQSKIFEIQQGVAAGKTAPQDKAYNKWDEYIRADSPGNGKSNSPKETVAAIEQNQTGDNYYYGRGVPVDYARALEWYRKAADQGSPKGQYNVGWMFANGRGVPANDAEAVEWYRKSADQGYPDAQNDLGLMYDSGRGGLPKDDAEAVKWYRKAADQGSPAGQYNFGTMYDAGRGVPENNAEALKWYRKAADQGYAPAQIRTGDDYERGWGTSKDRVEAYKWLLLSKWSGYNAPFRDTYLTSLKTTLTAGQVAEAERRAKAWQAQHPKPAN